MLHGKIIDWYLDRGLSLIPLREGSKAPEDNDWPNKRYGRAYLLAKALAGHGLGCRIGAKHCVIDIDPRNGGLEDVKKLKEKTGIDLATIETPHVVTGRCDGGMHVYFTCSPDQILRKNSEYKGLDIKRGDGHQVVAPGSIHPDTGQEYAFGLHSDLQIAPLPAALAAVFASSAPPAQQAADCSAAGKGAIISPEQLTEILNLLPVEEFDSNDTWLPVLAAAYHSTAGAGLGEFLAWSLQDPKYASHEQVIRARWRSMRNPSPSARSLGTLIYEIKKRGQPLPASLPRQNDPLIELLNTPIPEPPAAQKKNLAEINALIAELDEQAKPSEIEPVLRAAAQHPPLVRHDVIRRVAEATKTPKNVLAQSLQYIVRDAQATGRAPRVKKPIQSDLAAQIAAEVLHVHFADGAHLIHASDQEFWRYSGTHWIKIAKNIIEHFAYRETERFALAHPEAKISTSSIVSACTIILRARCATERDLFSADSARQNLINCKNCTLELDPKTGEVVSRPHKSDDYLTHCLPVAFDPAAKCPKFEEALRTFFDCTGEAETVANYLWEIIGYTVQARKDIPAWFLLHGAGENGKSTVLSVISALLGPAALHQSVGAFADDGFALADLVNKLAVIDDDVRHGTILPDDFLKKVSETKQLYANPKWGTRFGFNCSATVLLGSNSWPQTRDLSKGMRRRAYIIPFNHVFRAHEIIPGFAQKIIDTELAGVLVAALHALTRLRKREQFAVPSSCSYATGQWLSASNQLLVFLQQCYEFQAEAEVLDRDLWSSYSAWCLDSGTRKSYTRHGFMSALADLGYSSTSGVVRGFSQKTTSY